MESLQVHSFFLLNVKKVHVYICRHYCLYDCSLSFLSLCIGIELIYLLNIEESSFGLIPITNTKTVLALYYLYISTILWLPIVWYIINLHLHQEW